MSTLQISRPNARRYYTLRNPNLKSDDGWHDHVFVMNGTAFRVTDMWRETAATSVSVVSTAVFADCLFERVWTTNDTMDAPLVSPAAVIANLDAYPVHRDRILHADLSYPPIVFSGVYAGIILKNIILDGNHRAAYAALQHAPAMAVKYITSEQLARCAIS